MTPQGSILFVDAYDSFAENIAALLHEQLRVEVTLVRIDCDIPAQFKQSPRTFFASFDAIVLGPGPGNPQNESDVGLFNQVWACASEDNIPVLGICLGFQSLCVQNGVPVVRLGLPCHGHPKEIYHGDRDIFCRSGSIIATNYNSLGVRLSDFKRDGTPSRPSSSASSESTSSLRSLPSRVSTPFEPPNEPQEHQTCNNLEVLAWDKDDWVMAARHKLFPFRGFQFHPESCKSSSSCHVVIKQWWDATRKHNSAFRHLVSAPRATSPKVAQVTHPCESTALSRELESLSKTCNGGISRRSILIPRGSGIVASLCHQRSPPNASVMLESTKRGKYSIYAFPDESGLHLEYAGGRITLTQGSSPPTSVMLSREHVIENLESFLSSKSFQEDGTSEIPFRGGFMGFMSYELGTASLHLDVPEQIQSPISLPEISLLWVERSIVVDHHTGMAYVQSIRDNDGSWVDEMVSVLSDTSVSNTLVSNRPETSKLHQILSPANFTLPDHDTYISRIRACQSELLAGNSYELCLTTEATVKTPVTPEASWLLYNNIQQHNPVPFASFVRLSKITILSSSPEQFLSWSSKDGGIDMIPMKGTVKKTPEMTLAKATAILSSAKESAENLMIADLIRHDLYSTVGRHAKVEVVKLCDVVESETVFSLVSHIRAHVPLPPETDRKSDEYARAMARYGVRALTRTLPPGSMTGAPKKRSCEILHGLEQRERGVYSGAIGYMDVGGNGAWSVCIRTAFSNDDEREKDPSTGQEWQKWRIGAGGAITVLSDEEQEWEEMVTKLDSVLRGFQVD
ncbi:aminodeoxychorismate synthase [Cladophialophora psammophila CBS 110553]|uniref:aminodeoxychorismate synthase n=1 Tax=Cladophialophora psammophila CBS 110553 TaxID=1182543 RepID=W9X551_9EURO|nr:aminodeoxychorismate synthase [Cladophialophora psammophila CBS 110553]EXJ72430.1 aminodeoxychorismate synthase [Cladophialophora psammophila CBS 110553]